MEICSDTYLSKLLQPTYEVSKYTRRKTSTRYPFWRWLNYFHRSWAWTWNAMFWLGVRNTLLTLSQFIFSHLSTSRLCSVPAWIMTCQCVRSSAISVVIRFLAISSFTRSRHLSFGLPRFRFPSIVICNIFLMASLFSK